MIEKQDFLVEIGTEEIPAKLLATLANAFAKEISTALEKAELEFEDIQHFVTPRRLTVLVSKLINKQTDKEIERKGPALQAGYDAQGNPTPALQGFAKSCQTTIDKLLKQETAQGSWFMYRYKEPGKTVFELLPAIVEKAVKSLPIPKPMQWGNGGIEFIRPPHWLVMLYGSEVIPAKILGITSDKKTYGHRFHSPAAIEIRAPQRYEAQLKELGKVIVDFQQRQQLIRQQTEALAATKNGAPLFNEKLIDEVTGLVEWPCALLVDFDKDFLNVPKEALIAAMEEHQKSFPIQDKEFKLLPHFVTISNIESKDPEEVIRGNARVMRARLSDAKFFYETDRKQTLAERLDSLKKIIFQAKLGSLYEKSERLTALAEYIASTPADKKIAARAALLSKTDLASDMVNEFPELQGTMGFYYAKNDGEPEAVAVAIQEHYYPRFAGDNLPKSLAGCAVALADRIDSIIGIFAINQKPTGEKDPFGLRRSALAILRILIEKDLDLNLNTLLTFAKENYKADLPNTNAVAEVQDFIIERLHAWYQDQQIAPDTLAAVLAVTTNNPLDIDKRVKAVEMFRKLPEAASLAAANKRVKNLLKQAGLLESSNQNALLIEEKLFSHTLENELFQAISDKQNQLQKSNLKYNEVLTLLASLKNPVDHFFDAVLVMDENEKLRNNRLALLAALRRLFLTVADISLLQN